MADAGVSDVVLEVSSHALSQGRTNDCPFNVVVFTNFSRDHLDYHISMSEYFDSKAALFKRPKVLGDFISTEAVINTDDPKGRELVKLTDFECITYGLSKDCDIRAEDLKVSREGMAAKVITPHGVIDVESRLIGNFNIYNILAATAVAMSLRINLKDVCSGISSLSGVPGRLELVKNNTNKAIVVDYAHTPDALEKAILALKPLYKRLITVFGCGGDRDRGKRREMGLVAGKHSDFVIITSDNPRTEDPLDITLEIERGVIELGLEKDTTNEKKPVKDGGYAVNVDRREAIKQAVLMADEDTVVLIAGKGHEDYQIIGSTKFEFDDRKVASEAASGDF
jgi:UDP-N-acetylmuramoyl-L-alanyl-D-glutamate--2,6-diaminopimelate ligase